MDKEIDVKKNRPNFHCGSCKKKFVYNYKDIVRCPECGYRILFKERTLNYIEYSTN